MLSVFVCGVLFFCSCAKLKQSGRKCYVRLTQSLTFFYIYTRRTPNEARSHVRSMCHNFYNLMSFDHLKRRARTHRHTLQAADCNEEKEEEEVIIQYANTFHIILVHSLRIDEAEKENEMDEEWRMMEEKWQNCVGTWMTRDFMWFSNFAYFHFSFLV